MHRVPLILMLAAILMLAGRTVAQDVDPPPRSDQPPAAQPRDDQPGRRVQQRRREQQLRESLQFVDDVVYAEAPGADGSSVELLLDAAFLKQSGDALAPVIVYIHGGGYRAGSRKDGRRIVALFAAGGYFAVSIDYRLSDVATFPAAVHDCKAAVRFLRANAEELGIDPQRIGVFGHSAGGHLAALIAVTANTESLEGDLGETDVNSVVACAATLAGPVDFERLNEGFGRIEPAMDHEADDSLVAQWLGGPLSEKSGLARQASLLGYVDADDPPMLVVHGMNDNVVPFSQAAMLTRMLQGSGVEVQMLPQRRRGHDLATPGVILAVAEFFDAHLQGRAADAMREFGGRLDAPRRDGMPTDRVTDRLGDRLTDRPSGSDGD